MKKKVFILGLAFSLLMTGCGSSAEIGNGAGAAAPATSEETESEAEMYSFDKDSADSVCTALDCPEDKAELILNPIIRTKIPLPIRAESATPGEGNDLVIHAADGKDYYVGVDKKYMVHFIRDENGQYLYAVYQ